MGLEAISSRLARLSGARWRGALLAGCATLALAACTGNEGGPSAVSKSSRALSPQTLALISEKGMSPSSPLVVRIFKEESELEVWKENDQGEFTLLKTYPICRWSGELGPKIKEGDRQAPEGFYSITPGQMNPNSQYHLAFDLGFPNAFDKAHGRYGSNLMVHGDCSSRGCYAMTDEQVQEIFALGREAFRGGQRTFQVQAYPFRMTAENMVRHRNNPHMPFWRMLKEGSDTFELTRAQPKVNFCGKRYVFNATPVDGKARFDASAPCPEYTQPDDLRQALASRNREVSQKMASAGAFTPAAPVKTGKDGGMHKVFLAKLANPELKAPGSLPPVVKPPGSDYGVATNAPAPEESIALAQAETATGESAATTLAAGSVPPPAPRPGNAPGAEGGSQLASSGGTTLFGGRAAGTSVEVASADSGGGWLSGVSRLFGGGGEPTAEATSSAPASVGGAASVSMAPPASSAFSFSNLFGNGWAPQSAPAAVASPVSGMTDVPKPPARPAVPQARGASRPAAPTNRPTVAPPQASSTQPAVAPRAAASSYTNVPTPAAASAPVYSVVPTPAASAVGPELRPSVSSGALPGAAIMSSGGFSTTVQ